MPFAVLHSEAEWAAVVDHSGQPGQSAAEPTVVTIGNFDGVHLRPPANSRHSVRNRAGRLAANPPC